MCVFVRVLMQTPLQKRFQRRQNVFVDISSLMGNQCGGKVITSLWDAFHRAANRLKKITNTCMAKKKKYLSLNGGWTFSDTMQTATLQSSLENCFLFWYSSHFTSSFCLFFHSLSLCMLLAVDGDDRMGWIFNRFVSGSTMGGGIVVNIITYRSLRLHFPRPCQTGAITHSSQPHHQHTYTYTHIPSSHGWLWQCLSTKFHYIHVLWTYCMIAVMRRHKVLGTGGFRSEQFLQSTGFADLIKFGNSFHYPGTTRFPASQRWWDLPVLICRLLWMRRLIKLLVGRCQLV